MTVKKDVILANENYEFYWHRKKGIRNLRLAVKNNGQLTVTSPQYFPWYLIKNFLTSRQSWIKKRLVEINQSDSLFCRKFSRAEIIALKKKAREVVIGRLHHFNQSYNLSWKKISIRNQASRWGSCSKNKNLNFNFRISLLPTDLADYIIVHELCHLEELNHGPQFWNLVSKAIPNYRDLRAKLRKI